MRIGLFHFISGPPLWKTLSGGYRSEFPGGASKWMSRGYCYKQILSRGLICFCPGEKLHPRLDVIM